MRMDPVVNDAYRLRKLLEKATGLKVYARGITGSIG